MSNYFSNLKKNFSFFNIIMTFFIVFLPIFSFGIFGPTEIFFANHVTFGVVFEEFGWEFLLWGFLIAVVSTFSSLLLPTIIQKILFVFLWIVSLGGYIQTLFLNTGLDQIGATTEGYIPTAETLIKDSLIWLAIAVIATIVIIKSKDNWKKPVFLISLILTATQLVAYSTLFISAPKEAFIYKESDMVLSAEKQYVVSTDENVIVFILDTVSNSLFESALNEYPDLVNGMKDFTYYNNADCNYYGTFPSVPHILTAHDFDPSLPINTWLYDCWNNDATSRFYDDLHAAGYQINVYAIENTLFTGSEPMSMLEGKIDNLTTLTHNISIDYPLLYETLLTMSCYRFMPDYFKPYFDVPNTQYASIVTYPDNIIDYENPAYYSSLLEKGLTTDNENKYLIFQHLNGIHELINDEYCMPVEDSGSYTATIRGIWVMLEEYLNQLMDCGVYDNSTIIITSDHGSEYYGQSIFLIKEPYTRQDSIQITNAPITLDELLPTVAEITLGESSYLGNTIYDFSENEQRERTLFIRAYDSNYPTVNRYDGRTNMTSNVYHLYTYTGNIFDYQYLYDNLLYDTVPAAEAYY